MSHIQEVKKPVSLAAGSSLVRKRQAEDEGSETPMAKRQRQREEDAVRRMNEDYAAEQEAARQSAGELDLEFANLPGEDEEELGHAASCSLNVDESDDELDLFGEQESTQSAFETDAGDALEAGLWAAFEGDDDEAMEAVAEEEGDELEAGLWVAFADDGAADEVISVVTSTEPQALSAEAPQAEVTEPLPTPDAEGSRKRTPSVEVVDHPPRGSKRKARKAASKRMARDLAAEERTNGINRALGAKKGGNLAERFNASYMRPARPAPVEEEGRSGNPIVLNDDEEDSERTAPVSAHSDSAAPTTPLQRHTAPTEQLLTPRDTPSPPPETKKERRARLAREHQQAKEAREAAMMRNFYSASQEERMDKMDASRVDAGFADQPVEEYNRLKAPGEAWGPFWERMKRVSKSAKMEKWRASQRQF